jgi:lysophospholipase L1-like esterase
MKLAGKLAIVTIAGILMAGSAAAADSMESVIALLDSGRKPVRIVCFGDSITGVYYHTGGRRAWCDMLGIALSRLYPKAKLEMINAGISGNTSGMGLARMDSDVLARRPHLVVVMFGMNDAAGAPQDQFEANLRTIVRRSRAASASAVLCTPNSVYPNPRRPTERLAAYAQTVRQVALDLSVPLADCYQAYEDLHLRDPLAWKLLMSETIHPSMNGHKLFAEVIAQTISGRRILLADVPPPGDGLHFTLERLRAGQPAKVVAMPPYDSIVPTVLRSLFPEAQIEVTVWPTEGKSLAELAQWSKSIRSRPPHLVVVAVPAASNAEGEDAFLQSYSWILSYSIAFGQLAWDRVVVLPSVTAPLTPDQKRWEDLARQLTRGADTAYVDRRPGDARPATQLLQDFVRQSANEVTASPK